MAKHKIVAHGKIPLTYRQMEFLDFIKDFTEKNGRPPSFREISVGMDISSKGTVSAMVERLERSGKLKRKPGRFGLRTR